MKHIRLDLHLRFNPQNKRHWQAAAYMEPVKGKYRTALFVAAIEEYMQNHPYGVDYRELDEIRKGSYRSFQPKTPIQENLKRQTVRGQPPPAPAPVEQPDASRKTADALDQVIDFYGLDDME